MKQTNSNIEKAPQKPCYIELSRPVGIGGGDNYNFTGI